MKIAVIGGGSTYTPELIKGLLEIQDDIPIDSVWLCDVEEGQTKLEIIFEFVKRLVKERFKVFKTLNPEEALMDTDFVVFQFRPGFLKGRELDESLPLKYDLIGQETTGMGGFSSALRAFPIVEKYIDLVEKHSKATVINFTNPSGHVTEFVLNYLKFERFIGLCNVPISLLKNISEILNCDMDDIFLKYYGLNHLTFLERIYVKDKDVTEEIFERVNVNPSNIPITDFPRWLISSLSMFLNPYLRYYLMREAMLKKIKEKELRAREVMKIEKELLDIYKKAEEIPPELSKRGGSMYSTAAAHLIRDLTRGSGRVHILNTRNEGAVSNLPDDYVLEIPCYVKGGKVFPISMGKADEFALAFIYVIKMYERLTIKAYLNRSKDYALKAILVHPLGPGVEKAREFLEDMLSANKGWIDLE